MSDNVINIAEHRNRKKAPTLSEVICSSVDIILADWERFAKSNKLNDFFASSVPSHAKPHVNYLADLNEVSTIEKRIGLFPGVTGPGISGGKQLGWRAHFRFGDELIETPDMASEQYARCCNILIFLKVKREMVIFNRER